MEYAALRRSVRSFVLCTVAVSLLMSPILFAPGQAFAQLLQGALDGNVVDPTNAVLVGVTVAATNQETNARRETQTNSSGGYSLPALSPGTYSLTVSSPGFQTYVQTGIVVSTNSVTRVDVTMPLGQLSETVTVEAQAATLQTDRSDVRAEIPTKVLEDVPVPLGRVYQMLLVTLPGIGRPQNVNSMASNPNRSVAFNVNGTSSGINTTQIDGTTSGNAIDVSQTSQYVPSLETIETVNIVTNSYDAEQGLAGGAAINLRVKSGTNSVHGSLFEFHNNQHLKAYPWDGDRTQPQPKFIHNQFGGTIGGPIKRDRLFFFTSFEGTRYSENVTQVVQTATPAMRAGDLSGSPTAIYDPATGNPDGSGRLPFSGNQIPQARIDLGVRNFINTGDWPNPNQPGSGAFGLSRNFITSSGSGNGQTRNQIDEKINWNPSDKLTTFVRFGFLDHSAYAAQVFGPAGGPPMSRTSIAAGTIEGHLFNGTISATYVATPNVVIDGYFGYHRADVSTRPQRTDENLSWTVLQIPGLQSSRIWEGGWPRIEIAGFAGLGNTFSAYNYRDPQRRYATNITAIKGSHNLSTGFDYSQQHLNHHYTSGNYLEAGRFDFAQGTTQLRGGPAGNDFNAFGSFLLGLPSRAARGNLEEEYQPRTQAFSTFVRDRWQVTPKMTLNVGVRWEYFPVPRRVGRGVEVFDFTSGQVLLCGLGSNPIDCDVNYKGKQRFAPRLGLAYRVTDSFVVRAGYGMTNDPSNLANPLRLNPPDILPQVLNSPNSFSYATTFRQGLPAVPRPDLSSGVIDINPTFDFTSLDSDNTVRGYIQSWNLVLEKRVGTWITSAGYVATRSVNPAVNLQQNWSPIGTGSAGQILNQRFGRTASTNLRGSRGTDKYDSLQVRAEHRFAGGYHVAASYTFAKGMGNGGQVAIPYLYGLNYGALSSDVRHSAHVTVVAEAPFGRGRRWAQSGLASHILGGWQVNGVFSAYTGTPFTVTATAASLNAQFSGQFADCLSKPQNLGDISQWYDKTAFAPVREARFGTCGTNNLYGPALVNVDMGLDRNFQIGERFTLKFRAELFNITNTPHHSNPNSNASSGAFMQAFGISNTGRDGVDERTARFGLRLGW
jgi:hypothetical protein